MGGVVRRIGIAIGSLVAAALVVPLVAGVLLGSNANGNPALGLVIVVLGGLIYRDIIRREQRSA